MRVRLPSGLPVVAIVVAACSMLPAASPPPALAVASSFWAEWGGHTNTSAQVAGGWTMTCVVEQPAAEDPFMTIELATTGERITGVRAHLVRNGYGTVNSPGDGGPMSWPDTVTSFLGDNVERSNGGPPGLTDWVHEHPRGGEVTLADSSVRLVVGPDDATLTIQRP